MRSFGTEISGNRPPRGELLEAQRGFAIEQLEAKVSIAKVAATLKCKQRMI